MLLLKLCFFIMHSDGIMLSGTILANRIGLSYVRKILDMFGIQVFCLEIICLSGNLLKCPEFL